MGKCGERGDEAWLPSTGSVKVKIGALVDIHRGRDPTSLEGNISSLSRDPETFRLARREGCCDEFQKN